jgi:hypothetical protein
VFVQNTLHVWRLPCRFADVLTDVRATPLYDCLLTAPRSSDDVMFSHSDVCDDVIASRGGLFPGAVQVGSGVLGSGPFSCFLAAQPKTMTSSPTRTYVCGAGRLHVCVPAGKVLVYAEVMVGDAFLAVRMSAGSGDSGAVALVARQRSQLGVNGVRSNATVSLSLSACAEPVATRRVGGHGVAVVAGAAASRYVSVEGDELVVSTEVCGDVTGVVWVLGYRLWLLDASDAEVEAARALRADVAARQMAERVASAASLQVPNPELQVSNGVL